MKSQLKLATIISAALGGATAMAIDPYVAPEDPYSKPDGSWIAISGTVLTPDADSFILDYGSGMITVEMDDWDRVGEAVGLIDGDPVTVYGAIDDDTYELAKIEAGSVYVENLNTYFYANSADEEGATTSTFLWYSAVPLDANMVTVMGTVTSVNKEDEEFVVDSGVRSLEVNAGKIGYNVFDDLGFQKIQKGDVVSVTGSMDYEFFDGRELEADRVTTLYEARSSN
tara:strand:+ start:2292 stop:2972 length:681 start_codon:yes stop_codon:yes gene_type:complete